MIKIRDIMVVQVITANPEDTVAAAAKQMREMDVGCLVVAVNNQVEGILTDRDLLGCVSAGHDAQQCCLTNHMSTPVVTASPDEELLDVAQLMSERKIKRVPLVKDDQIVGLLSYTDISHALDKQIQGIWGGWTQLTRSHPQDKEVQDMWAAWVPLARLLETLGRYQDIR